MTTITTSGENFMAAFASGRKPITVTDDQGQPLLGDCIIVAYVDGLDTTATPPTTETVPDTTLGMYFVNRGGLANDHTAVFSALIPATAGDYSFNWVGLYNSEYDVLIAVDYVPITPKTATAGTRVGNTLNHTFALTITSAAAVTGLTVALDNWQPDYTNRLQSSDEITRQALLAVLGPAAFETAAGEIIQATEYTVGTGRACIAGLLVDIPATELTGLAAEETANHPFYVYATATQQGDINGLATWATVETSQTTLDSYTSGGYTYHRALLATITEPGVWTDNRASVASELMAATVKTANDNAAAAVATAASAETTAAAAAATAASAESTATGLADSIASANTTANSAVTDSAAAQSTADGAVTAAAAAQSTADGAAAAAAAAQSTANARMIGSNNLNEVSSVLDSRENLGIFQIVVESDGTVRDGPTGWTVNQTDTGKYQVFPSPPIGTSINVMANRIGPDIGYAGENTDTRAANFFEIRTGTNAASTNNWVAEDGPFIATVFRL